MEFQLTNRHRMKLNQLHTLKKTPNARINRRAINVDDENKFIASPVE